MSLLREFADKWKLKVEGERISSCYGFIMECNGESWYWTHSHTPTNIGHRFFHIREWGDEIEAVFLVLGEN